MLPPVVLAALGFCGALFLLKLVFPYAAPFLLGLLLALMLDVPVSYLETRGWPRPVSAFALVAVTFLSLPALAGLVLFRLWRELQGLLALGLLTRLTTELSDRLLMFLKGLPVVFERDVSGVVSLPLVLGWAMAIPDLFLVWTLTALSAYFFLRDKHLLVRLFIQQLSKRHGAKVLQLYRQASGALWHLLRIQLLLVALSTGVSVAFFSLLQLPFPLLSGFLVGFFDLCPVLGPGLVYLILALLDFFQGNTQRALALGVGYLIVLLLRQWGEPKLLGERFGLHPLSALLGVYVGFRFWGPLGAVAGPLLLVFVQACLRYFATSP